MRFRHGAYDRRQQVDDLRRAIWTRTKTSVSIAADCRDHMGLASSGNGQTLIAKARSRCCLTQSQPKDERTARAAREKKTIRAMIIIYCVGHHRPDRAPCSECRQLLEYAEKRIDRCPLMEDKPTCANCSIHCYEASRREQIRSVMRYSGPKMIYHHPILSVCHLADGRKKKGKGFGQTTSREPPTP